MRPWELPEWVDLRHQGHSGQGQTRTRELGEESGFDSRVSWIEAVSRDEQRKDVIVCVCVRMHMGV